MRAILFALILLPTASLAQDATPAKRPSIGGKPLVQVKPSALTGCKFVGTVRGTKLWAGDCMGSELRTTMPAEETSKSLADQAVRAVPKAQQ
jgi:hypothetical protein